MTASAPSADPTRDDPRALLSALADGDAAALIQACALWRDDEASRQTWHTYHLIGDVLRSEDLAKAPARDEAFLQAVRARLAQEPVVLAPVAPPARWRQQWLAPAAVAAGFVAVAGVLVVARVNLPADGQPVLAAVPRADNGLTLASTQASAPQRLVVQGRVIRDAQLDSYLQAHREARGGMAAAVPGGAPRNVDTLTVNAAGER